MPADAGIASRLFPVVIGPARLHFAFGGCHLGRMTLVEIIRDLDQADDALTICAARSPGWSEASEALLQPSGLAAREFPLLYFLEVTVARDVLSAWSYARGGRVPTLSEATEALIFYAENDAYLLPEPGGPANRSQPVSSETRRTPPAAGSGG